MSDVNQAALLEILAGKNRANTAAAILANTTDLEEAYVQALNAEGSALQENEKYLDSIQGRIDLFVNAWQNFWNNLLDDEVIKWIVSLGTEVLKLTSTFGELRTILFLTFTYLNLTGKADFLSSTVSFVSKLSSALSGLEKRLKSTKKTTEDVSKAVSTIDTAPTSKSARTSKAKQKLLGAGADETKSTEKSANRFSEIWKHHIQRVKDSFNRVKQDFTTIWQHHNERVAQSVEYASGQLNKLKTFASNAFNSMSKSIGNVGNSIRNVFGDIFNRTKVANPTQQQGVAPYAGGEQKEANRFSQIWQHHIERLKDSINRVKQDLSTIWQHHNERVAWSVKYTETQFGKLKSSITNTIQNIAASFGKVKNVFGKINIGRTKVAPVDDVQTEDVAQAASSTNGLAGRIKKMQAEFNRLWQNHLVRVNDSVNGMKNAFTTLWKHHTARVSESMSYAGGLFNNFKAKVVSKLGEIKGGFQNIANEMIIGFKMTFAPIANIFDKIANKAKSKMGEVKSTISDAFDILKQRVGHTNTSKQSGSTTGGTDLSEVFAKASHSGEKLQIDDLDKFTEQINEFQKMDNSSIVKYIQSINDMGNAAKPTQKALAAYAASVKDGNYSAQAGAEFVDAHNAKIKASGVAAKMAAVGHGLLNAALSMGLSIVIQFAMEGLMKLIKYLGDAANPTEALADEISNLGSKISDTESEIDTINSDLETCKERMAELLAMPSLSLVEQEELDNLKTEIAMLERKLQLQEMLLESQTAKELATKTEYIDEAWNDQGKYNIKGSSGIIREDAGWTGFWDNSSSTTEILTEAMEKYQDREEAIAAAEDILLNWDSASLSEKNQALLNMDTNEGGLVWSFLWNDKDKYNELIEEAKSMNQEVATSIEDVFSDENYSGLSYGLNNTVDNFLDEFYAYQYKWNDMLGMDSKSEAIGSIFDDTTSGALQNLKAEIEEISASEDELGDKQKQIANKINAAVNSQNDAYRRLTTTMKIAGVTAEEIAEYFTLGGGLSDFDTLDVKIEEVARASKTFEDLLKGQEFEVDGMNIGLAELFDEEGKIVQTKLSQIFNNTSEQTRKDITSILENAYDGIKDGTVNIESLMTKFAFKTGQQIIDIQKSLLTTVNQELFPNLEGEISGIIDTFNELAAAVGNVVDAMDLLDQARAEEVYSGSISLETLQNLMAYTDDYAKLVSIDETGAIHLAANAQEILIQEKLNAIKANAQLAYEEANKAYQEALAAETSVGAANTLKNVLTPAIDQVSGGLAFLGSLWSSVKSAFAGGLDGIFDFSISDAISQAQSAYNSTISSRQYNRETEAETTLAQAKEALERAEANLKIANNLTADNVKTRYSSEEASGGTSNATEAADKKAEDAEKAAQEKFDKLRKEYEFKISQKENEQKSLENEIARMEANDEQVGKAIYERQIELENEKIKLLEEEHAKLLENMKTVPKYSDLWYDYADAVWETEHAIQDATVAALEHKQAIADLYIEAFNKIGDAYDKQQELYDKQSDYIRNNIEYAELTDQPISADYYKQLEQIQKNKLDSVNAEIESLSQQIEIAAKASDQLEDVEEKLQQYGSGGNVDLLNRPMIDSSKVAEAGWKDVGDGISTVFTNTFSNEDGTIAINFTPILPDGSEVLSPDELQRYAEEVIAGTREDDLNLQIGAAFNGNDAINQAELAAKEIHNLQDTYYLSEGYLSDEELADLAFRLQDSHLEAQEVRNEIANINEELKQLYVTAFDKVGEAFDAMGNLYDDRAAYTEGYIEIQELKGEPVSTDAYDYLIENTQNAIANAEGKLAEQQAKLQNAIANGIKVGSEDWIKMTENIRATEAELQGHHKTLIQYTEDLKQLYYTAFEKVRDSFGDVTDVYDDQQAFIESYVDYLETIGVAVPNEVYDELISVEEQKQQANIQKLADLEAALAKMEAEGFGPEDEEWVTAQADIRATEKAIWDSEVAMAEFNKRMRELETEKFEEFVKRIGDLVNELDRVYDLLSDEDVATEDGAWTEEGITSLGLMYQKMEIAKKQIADYQDEIDKLNEQYKSGAISEQEYNDRLVDLKNNQWDSVEALESAKDAIVDLNEARIDMIEEGIQKEIEAYEELIQLKKDELDAERDLYEFKKNIEDQTDDIASLERRIAAMSGSTDAATVAERTKLEAQLREARKGLDDTYYTHAMDSQSSALDDENESYVTSKEDYIEMLRETLEDVEKIVSETMAQVFINADSVLGGLNGVSEEYGITLSDALKQPWISAAEQAEAFKNGALAGEYEFAIQNGIFTGTITDQLSAMFGQGTTMAYQFSSDVYTAIDTIKYTVNEASPFIKDDLVIPFSDALNYVQNTFSPYTLEKLQEVANKADSLVYSETEDLTAPWNSGTEAVNTYGDTAEIVLEQVVENAIKYDPSYELTSPLDAAGNEWDMFGTKVADILSDLVTKANQDAAKIGTAMDDIVADAKAAADAIAKTGTSGGGNEKPKTNPTPTPTPKPEPEPEKKITGYRCMATVTVNGKEYQATAVNKTPASAKTTATQYLYEQLMKKYKDRDGNTDMARSMWEKSWSKKVKHGACVPVYYAKGTLGTKKDGLAITDESWIGEEITLAAGRNGQLQYLKKGSAVMPADISANLVEWGKLNPDMMNMNNNIHGVNLMTNYVNKPEVNLEFESLLHIDNCSQDSVEDVKKIVTEQLDKFTRKLNTNLRQFK